MSWIAAVDYRQGVSHRRGGVPCQDFGRLLQPDENTVIAALSDGAGSAVLSHLGARIAVNAALGHVGARIAKAPGSRGAVTSLSAEDLFAGVAEAARAALRAGANDNRVDPDDLACTLTVVALAPNAVMACQVGDGIVVTRMATGGYTLLVEPKRGEYANETDFVTDPGARLRIAAAEGPVRFLSAATDGLLPVSIDNKDRRPHAPFFRPIDRFAHASRDGAAVHDGIREFLASDRLAARVDDDLALMVCGWRGLTR
jgi:hypothetical protein